MHFENIVFLFCPVKLGCFKFIIRFNQGKYVFLFCVNFFLYLKLLFSMKCTFLALILAFFFVLFSFSCLADSDCPSGHFCKYFECCSKDIEHICVDEKSQTHQIFVRMLKNNVMTFCLVRLLYGILLKKQN